MFKKVSDGQEVVLQELTEEQMAQAAGGNWKHSDHDWDDYKKKHHHHHHHHHHHMMHKTQNHNGFIEEKIVTTTKTIFVPANQVKW